MTLCTYRSSLFDVHCILIASVVSFGDTHKEITLCIYKFTIEGKEKQI